MPDTEIPLEPLAQETVDVFGAAVPLVEVEVDGRRQRYVPLRPVVEHLGLSWRVEEARVRADLVLQDEMRRVRLAPEQVLLALPLAFFHGWLFGLPLDLIEDRALRGQLAAFQQAAIEALHRALGPLPLDLAALFGSDRPAGEGAPPAPPTEDQAPGPDDA